MRENLKSIANTVFFKPAWYAIFVNPYFIARKNLYKKILIFSKEISGNKILDLGCGSKPYADLFLGKEYIGIDVNDSGHSNSSKNNDIFFDGKIIPFSNDAFDVVICTQVLEHAKDPEILVQESRRVLKTGGVLYLTCPFIWPEHEIPYDFRRYTQFGLKQLLEDKNFRVEKLESGNGVFATTGQLISAFLFEIVGKNIFLRLMMAITFCFVIQFVALLLDYIFKHKGANLDYIVRAKKYAV